MRKTYHAVFMLALGFASATWANDVNTGQVFVSPDFSGGTGAFSQTTNNPGVIDISGNATGGFNSSGSASLHLQPGEIKMAGEFSGSGSSVVRGTLRDDLTFTSPGVASGTFVDVTFAVSVDGSLSANDVGYPDSSWQLQAGLGGVFNINRSGTLFGTGPYVAKPGYSGDPFGLYTATAQVQIGYAAPLDIELSGSAQAAYEYDSGLPSASFALNHSLYWAGITNVSLNGISLPSYSVSSSSGLDYANSLVPAVPEPGALPLCVLGLGCLLACTGRFAATRAPASPLHPSPP